MRTVRTWVLVVVVLLQFAVWSNSFIAVSYLLGREGDPARLSWVGLTVARFVPAALICGAFCLFFRRAEAWAVLRRHGWRLLLCGSLAVPGYNLALGYGQQHGVPAPIASLTTTLVPLFVMALAALFLGERLTRRRIAGFIVAAAGMVLITAGRMEELGGGYALLIAITALAPLCWSVYSVLSKPMTGKISPIVWTYLSITLGGLLVLPLLPGRVAREWVTLDSTGWAALLYLSLPCTVLGFAIWTWLLRHLPATTVGFTVFLNPPLTTGFKYGLSRLFPETFAFAVSPQEWAGGAVTLVGLAIAVYVPRLRTRPQEPPWIPHQPRSTRPAERSRTVRRPGSSGNA